MHSMHFLQFLLFTERKRVQVEPFFYVIFLPVTAVTIVSLAAQRGFLGLVSTRSHKCE